MSVVSGQLSVVEIQRAVKVTVLMIEYNGLQTRPPRLSARDGGQTTDKGHHKKGGKENDPNKCQGDLHKDAGGF